MSTQKRQIISTEAKKQIIDESEAHPTKSLKELADQVTTDKLTLKKSNVQTILDGKQKVLDTIDKGIGGKRSRLKPAKYEDLEDAHQRFLIFRQYFEENGLNSTLLPAFGRIEDLSAKMKQPTLFDYFTHQ